MGVIKNIIPAIASTNALVSAACVNECIKILTGCNYRLKNVSYNHGQTRMNIQQMQDLPKKDCLICSPKKEFKIAVSPTQTLQDFITDISSKLTLSNPTITFNNTYVLCSPGFLGKGSEFKLQMTWENLVKVGHHNNDWEYEMLDKSFASSVKLRIIVQ